MQHAYDTCFGRKSGPSRIIVRGWRANKLPTDFSLAYAAVCVLHADQIGHLVSVATVAFAAA